MLRKDADKLCLQLQLRTSLVTIHRPVIDPLCLSYPRMFSGGSVLTEATEGMEVDITASISRCDAYACHMSDVLL